MPNPTGVENLTSSDFEIKKPKILFFDIETAPNLGYVWGKYEQNVIEFTSEWYMLAWSAKWKDGKHITKCLADYEGYDPLSENDRLLVTDLHKLLAEADIVIAHNGNKFDVKRSNTRFIEHGLLPPEPYKVVDTLQVARKHFGFTSNKLDDLGHRLGVGRKVKTGGFDLWKGCMSGDPKAWRKMKAYNRMDVLLLERVYDKLLPWISGHPSIASLEGNEGACPACGDTHIQNRGWTPTPTGVFRRRQCMRCGHWFRGKHKRTQSQ